MKVFYTSLLLLLGYATAWAQTCTPGYQCFGAPLFCGYSLENQTFNNNGPIGFFSPNCGPNFVSHSSNWFRIVPCSPNLSIDFYVLSTFNGDGLQVALYTACNSGAAVACNPGVNNGAFAPLSLNATVVPGQEYYLQVDGYDNDICDYIMDVISGIDTAEPPPPVPTATGEITSVPSGNNFCTAGEFEFTADWPACDTFTTPQLTCYKPEIDSCDGLKWTFPPGTVFIGDPYANPVRVHFNNVPPGNYTIKVKPMECDCPPDLCPSCGQLCCPAEELELPITISPGTVTYLPVIAQCGTDFPPACATGYSGGSTAYCQVSVNTTTCEQTVQPYELIPAPITNLGEQSLCEGQAFAICDTTFTEPGTYTYYCTCDSAVTVTLVEDFACLNDCEQAYNTPAPPGINIATAPLLCGSFLDGYCSSNSTGQGPSNTVFLRITPCEASIVLRFALNDCINNQGLAFSLLDSSLSTVTAMAIISNNTALFNASGLTPYDVYYLQISGLNADICGFTIEVVSGIGTGDPTGGAFSCNCTPATISGPSQMCPGDVVSFSIAPGSCDIVFNPNAGGGSGGNGYYCCPNGGDSRNDLDLVWHLPPYLSFISDSVNVNTVTAVVNPNLGNNGSITIMDSVWVSYELASPAEPLDSLSFCYCVPGCTPPGPGPKMITIQFIQQQYNCQLTCNNPVCTFMGQSYTSPGVYIEGDNCFRWIINISQNLIPPFVSIVPPPPLTCVNPTATLVANISGGTVLNWSGPGIFSPTNATSITVFQPGVYVCTAIRNSNGCTATASVVVTADLAPPVVVLSPSTAICAGGSTVISTAGSSSGGQFIYSWNNPPGAGGVVSPTTNTTYQLTITNVTNGCTNTAATTVTVNQPTVITHAIQTLCYEDWPPQCPGGVPTVSGNTATCSVLDAANCVENQYSFQRLPPLVTVLNYAICPGDSYIFNGETYTQLNTTYDIVLSSYQGCDSLVQLTLVPLPGCLPLCTNSNFPTAPADSCHLAPFLCGNYLDNYCSDNSNLTDDVLDGQILDNAGFLRFSPCADSVHLNINVGDCAQSGGGMQFYLMSGDCGSADLSNPLTIMEGQSGQYLFNGLSPDITYYFVFANTANTPGNTCQFLVDVVGGIGTATPEPASCACTDGSISGPASLCPADVAVYELVLPSCTITPGAPVGGNGYYCCPGGTPASDSIIWHLPSGFNFLSDSVNVNQITVQVDSSFLGIDTIFSGQIFVTFVHGGVTDTLQFCDCGVACATNLPPLTVEVSHTVSTEFCAITCVNPVCVVNNIPYSAPGTYVDQSNCATLIVIIEDNTLPPFAMIQQLGNTCAGMPIDLTVIANSFHLIEWSIPASGTTITVPGPGVYSVTVTDPSNGCTATASIIATQPPEIVAATSPDITICAGTSTILSADGSSVGPNFIYQWDTGQSGFSIEVAPLVTTTYTLTVLDINTGCFSATSVTVIVEPPQVVQLGVLGSISCATPCFDFNGKTYCAEGNYADTSSCVIQQFSLVFEKDSIQAGTIGTITCAETCVTYQGQQYCQAGNYETSDACAVYFFSINTNLVPPAHSTPTHTCLPSNTSYAVGFSITGTPPYKINGTLIAGSYYLSEPVNNGETYTFLIEQTSNGCENLVTGVFDCALMCGASAGTMSGTPVHTCVDAPVVSVLLVPGLTGPGDTTEFVLHTSASDTLGQVIAQNSDGVFAFNANTMQMETVYYVSHLAGPKNSAGNVDTNHICTRVSVGQPVVFHALPQWDSVQVTHPTCFGWSDGTVEMVGIQAAAPWTIALNGAAPESVSVWSDLSAGNYTLLLSDANDCQSTATATLLQPDSVWLTVTDSREILPGETVLLNAETNVPPPVWTNNTTQEQYTGNQWLVRPDATTEYNCIVTDPNGCTALATVTLRVAAEGLYYPNVINLNDADPVNRWFTIFAVPNYVQEIRQLSVFDRWGSRVFEGTNLEPGIPEQGWNGTEKGKSVTPGVFAFTAQILLRNGTVKNIAGDVTVVR